MTHPYYTDQEDGTSIELRKVRKELTTLRAMLGRSLAWVEHTGEMDKPFSSECSDKEACLKCDILRKLMDGK